MKMYDEKPSYRELAIQHLKENTLCRGHIDYFVGELQKLERIKQLVKEWENSKIVTNCYECAEQIKEVLEQE